MEDFANLKWRISDLSKLESITGNFITEENISNSYVYANNFKPLDLGIVKKSNGNKCNDKPKQLINSKPLNYPQYSALTNRQHRICLKALKLLETPTCQSLYTKEEQLILTTYNNLKWHIVKENDLFLKFVENEWKKIYHLRRKTLMGKLYFLAKNNWYTRLQAVKTYDQFFSVKSTLPLSSTSKNIEVFFEACLLELGTVASISFPPLDKKIELSQNLAAAHDNTKETTKLPCSKDLYAEKLAEKNGCDIVITLSGLKTIIDNYGSEMETSWDIPVFVKEYDYNGRKKTVAFIDKPFPSRTPTILELNLKCWKNLLKLNFGRNLIHTFEQPTIFDNKPTNDDKNINLNKSCNSEIHESNSIHDSESTNSDVFECSPPKKIKINSEISEAYGNKESCTKPADVTSESNESKSFDTKMPNIASYADLSLFDEKGEESGSEKLSTKCKKSRPNHRTFKFHNVSYRMWKLKLKNEKNALLKEDAVEKDVRFLVRSKTDGCEIENDNIYKPVTLIPQFEFQAQHGGRRATKSEILRNWVSVYFRPHSQIVNVRINPATREYLKIERLNINQVVQECLKHYNFTPTVGLEILYNVLSNMINLEPGHYLLHHTPKHGPFVALMKSVSNTASASVDLHNLYNGKNCKIDETVSWCPIDTTLIMPNHVSYGKMPGMFPPRNPYVQLKGKIKHLKRKKNRK